MCVRRLTFVRRTSFLSYLYATPVLRRTNTKRDVARLQCPLLRYAFRCCTVLRWRMTTAAPALSPDERCIAAACLGRLGRWGNQVFQYACCALAGEAHGAKLLLPPAWPGRAVLAEAAAAEPLHAEFEAGLPLCADRPLLSHVGWRAWASSREPLASAAQRNGGTLSGRQARALALRAQFTALTCRRAGAPPGAAGERKRAARGWLPQRRRRGRRRGLRRRACSPARVVGLVCV